MLARCFGLVAFEQHGIVPLCLLVTSLSNHPLCCPSTPLPSSSPSPLHIHHHQSFIHVFLFSYHHMPVPPSPIFLHILRYFSHFRCHNLSFLILSIFVTPHIHLNILISATFKLFSCTFFTVHISDHCWSCMLSL